MKSKPTITVFSSPKQVFQSDPNLVSLHQKMVDSDICEASLETALTDLVYELSDKVNDSNSAMGAGFQLRGAVKFLKRFKELAELTKPAPPLEDPGELRPQEDKRRP
jgi:hypothetical protein